jgi:SAM-dependent methyltransferase
MNQLEAYYNKFNEEKRLNSRHGQVEYYVTTHYVKQYLKQLEEEGLAKSDIKILDVGAGTGRYAIPLSEEGYDVTAIEPVHHNLGRSRANGPKVKAFEGRAEKLKQIPDESCHIVLFFGPMYHLKDKKLRLQAMQEAHRVLKTDGHLFISYIMNDYSVLMYGFKEHHIKEAMATGMIDQSFHCTDTANPLYDYARLEDIYELSNQAGFTREKILSADGPANHLRQVLNALDEEEFELFLQYQLSVCERPELLGAGCHTLDILRK